MFPEEETQQFSRCLKCVPDGPRSPALYTRYVGQVCEGKQVGVVFILEITLILWIFCKAFFNKQTKALL